MLLARVLGIPHFHDFSSPWVLRKGLGRLFGELGSSLSPPWFSSFIHGGFSPFGIEEEDELQIGGGNVKER